MIILLAFPCTLLFRSGLRNAENTIDEVIAYLKHDTSASAVKELAEDLKLFLARNSREVDQPRNLAKSVTVE